jgi:hypothetical protein
VLRNILPATPEGQPIELNPGAIQLVVESGTGTRPDRVVLSGGGYATAELAWAAARSTKSALRATAVATDVPIQLAEQPGRRPIGWSQEILVEWRRLGVGEERGDPQFDVYEEVDLRPSRTRIEAEGYLQRQIDRFTDVLETRLTAMSEEPDPRSVIAAELYLSTTFESSTRARFLTLVTVLEVLAARTERTKKEVELIERWLADIEREDIPQSSRSSLRSSVSALRERSIGASIRDLAAGDGPAKTLFTSCYRIRSKMTHDGLEPPGTDLSIVVPQLSGLVQQLLLQRLEPT